MPSKIEKAVGVSCEHTAFDHGSTAQRTQPTSDGDKTKCPFWVDIVAKVAKRRLWNRNL